MKIRSDICRKCQFFKMTIDSVVFNGKDFDKKYYVQCDIPGKERTVWLERVSDIKEIEKGDVPDKCVCKLEYLVINRGAK